MNPRALAALRSYGPLLAAAVALLAAPAVLSDFRLNLLGKFLTYAIVALGLDLVWGYGGMLSLGQGLFFALGGYAVAMNLKLESAGSALPDFMVWSGREALPWFWEPFRSPTFALLAAVLVPAALAAILGLLVFQSRVQGVYFSLITQALTLIASIVFIGQQAETGGTNGITNLRTLFGAPRAAPRTELVLYLVTALALLALYLLCRGLVRSRFGRLLVAARDDEDRVRFLGHDPAAIKTVAFALSAGMAGLAGGLFVAQVGLISPSTMGVVPSVEMVTWVAVGGRGTLAGAAIGAILVSLGKSQMSESFPDAWQLGFGALFAALVLLLPGGVLGGLAALARKLGRRAAPFAAAASPAKDAGASPLPTSETPPASGEPA